ncbi:MAG: membrane protein insertion efficiency factor YidD [Candidatus Marinimicrobia bacterium]|nr:membrane protein insertion efficiency factor YidD [Candidatus Neomarinimicrobiota bacterium]MBT7684093.1 membrane protein insertion efficiency factor YidD [Candidatus Neomarinimicrobiota bacterium]
MANRYLLLLAIFIFVPLALSQESNKSKNDHFSHKLNHLYQTKIGSKTIHRCPFEVSCSNFLIQSVENYGWIKGTALFIDRYFYRENKFVQTHYKSINRDDKVVYRDEIPDSLTIYLYSN